MASLRKGKCYRLPSRGYTRKSKYKKKGFIKSIPASKVVRYHMGDIKKEFPSRVKLISKEKFQIRHNAIESCRMMLNKHFQRKFGPKGYHFHINVVPHQVLRENKMLTGAGADRMQTGMAHSFGKAMGVAAIVKVGSVIFEIDVEKESVEDAKTIMKMAKSRIAGRTGIEISS
ncbi:MAG: 50S ribosomal protein L16 [Candidatus Woesearchaeota archaeon]